MRSCERCVHRRGENWCSMYNTSSAYCADTGCNQFVQRTNGDLIRYHLSNEALAELLVTEVAICQIDYDWEENSYETWDYGYKTSDGEEFFDFENAVEHELEWLQQSADE